MSVTVIGVPCPFRGYLVLDHLRRLAARAFGGEDIVVPAGRRSKLLRAVDLIRGRRGGSEVGLFVVPSAADLSRVAGVANWRRRFKCLAAYVIDSWYTDWFGAECRFFDALFVSRIEDVAPVRARTDRPVHYLPFGADVLGGAAPFLSDRARPTDLLVYGRQPPAYGTIVEACGRAGLSVRSGIPTDDDCERNQRNIYAAAAEAKFALGFSNTVHYHPTIPGDFGPFLTFRWLDNLASGAVMVGVLPRPAGFEAVVGWDGAYADLPLDPAAGVAALEELVAAYDPRTALRNHYESLVRNDWRLRLRDVLTALAVPFPTGLVDELGALEAYGRELANRLALVPVARSAGR